MPNKNNNNTLFSTGNYRLGVCLVMLAGVCLSTGGLLVRHIEAADGWQILFYRSIAFTLTVLVFISVQYRGRIISPFLNIGWNGYIAAIALGIGFACYLFSIILTNVANVVFILSTSPFFAALLGWIVLGEKVQNSTWLAMLLAACGIALMLTGDLGSGRWLGNLIAVSAAAVFAVMIVAMRRARSTDMMPATCLAGIIAMVAAFFMLESFVISPRDLLLAILLGSVQVGAGFILITLGTRHLPAADVALLALTETILAPLWVWWFIGEVPTLLAFLGGGIVLTAVLSQGLIGIHRSRHPIAERPTQTALS